MGRKVPAIFTDEQNPSINLSLSDNNITDEHESSINPSVMSLSDIMGKKFLVLFTDGQKPSVYLSLNDIHITDGHEPSVNLSILCMSRTDKFIEDF